MLAFHGIFATYGFWLPNDPRGSWSDFVASWELYLAGGKATKVSTPRSLAKQPHDFALRQSTKLALKLPPVTFTGQQALIVGQGFAEAIRKAEYKLFACSILPEHVHVVISFDGRSPRRVLGHLRREASLLLKQRGMHPFQGELAETGQLPTCWSEGSWSVYLDTMEDVYRAVCYAEENPLREGKPKQRWSFVRDRKFGSVEG